MVEDWPDLARGPLGSCLLGPDSGLGGSLGVVRRSYTGVAGGQKKMALLHSAPRTKRPLPYVPRTRVYQHGASPPQEGGVDWVRGAPELRWQEAAQIP